MQGLRLRSPNKTVSAALEHLGAVPAVLQVNEVMDAVKDGRIEGIVTNWGNPLQGFNDVMKTHTDLQFYTSAFFIVMNKDKYDSLPPDVQAAIDEISGETLVAQFGPLWDKWAKPVREGAEATGHAIVVPSPEQMAEWRQTLQPVTNRYLDQLEAAGFAEAHAAYQALRETLRP